MADDIPNSDKSRVKLRMAPPKPPEDIAGEPKREPARSAPAASSAKFRVGSVKYLNAVPLTRGIESDVIYAEPAQLAEMLRRDELDAALVSVTEVLLNDRYDILDGVAIASLGEVYSVLLAHRQPLAEIKEVFCHTASLSGLNLLKVLLAEQGLKPEFKPLSDLEKAAEHDAFLIIGDPAIDFQRAHPPSPAVAGSGATGGHKIFDLGTAWYELTNLPFVFAVWALRRGVENKELCRDLRDAKDFGMETLNYVIETRTEYDEDFRRDYLTWHVHYHLAEDEKRGIAKFAELLQKHGFGPVFEPKFVS
jgi:predicted solute-binding protein